MMAEESDNLRLYAVTKRLEEPAKLAGLNFITFFLMLGVFAILIFGSSAVFGTIGMIVAGFICAAIYGVLWFLQERIGDRKLGKFINDFYNPIDFIKVKTSFSRMYNKKSEIKE